jgi:hypothetical protein
MKLFNEFIYERCSQVTEKNNKNNNYETEKKFISTLTPDQKLTFQNIVDSYILKAADDQKKVYIQAIKDTVKFLK